MAKIEDALSPEDRNRVDMRKGLLENEAADPFAFERIIGESNLLSINFMDRGRRSADAVCRIKLPMEGGIAYGSGFLVGPRLLMTNNHVIANISEATQAEAEFGYEHDLDGVVKAPVTFNLDPGTVFFTSTELDCTLVAVASMSNTAVPLERYGWLPLIPVSGKAVVDEAVSIIQHPDGLPKQIAIHASTIIKLGDDAVSYDTQNFIHYSTDTNPGSSGAPVLNDQWQVVAIHHKAILKPGAKMPPADSCETPQWLCNEGVRVSAIYKWLERNRFENINARKTLDRLNRGLGFPPLARSSDSHPVDPKAQEQYRPYTTSRWRKDDLGYDPSFLIEPVSFEDIYAPLVRQNKVAPLKDSESEYELRYFHYSSVLHAERKFPLMVAVNIHGAKLVHPGTRRDTWRPDGRIDRAFQPDDEFYVRTRQKEAVYFSRGHLVRLLDPCWSLETTEKKRKEDAKRAMQDTFHFTNAAPQFQRYNSEDWGDLEDYLLDRAQTTEKKMTIFTGPVFRKDDPWYGRDRKGGPWQIPLTYWKIAVIEKSETEVAAAAFMVGQTEYIQALYESRVFSGLKPYSLDEIRARGIQTTIATVESYTGLDFSSLKQFDSNQGLESTRQTRWLTQPEDIVI